MSIADQAWESFGLAYDAWRESLTENDDAYYFDAYGTDSLNAFFAAHPDGWSL